MAHCNVIYVTFSATPFKITEIMLNNFSLIRFPVNFQVLNISSKRRVIGHYIAANSLFVSQILLEL